MTSRRIILWRHGRTAWNAERRFQGQTDIPLDDTGLAQASRAAKVLARLHPHRIHSSDLMKMHLRGVDTMNGTLRDRELAKNIQTPLCRPHGQICRLDQLFDLGQIPLRGVVMMMVMVFVVILCGSGYTDMSVMLKL